ncbi:unnamed protein product [Paramecium sonneborni]|uniref:Uncharacterized protein n=1 Tax=Paramecium sonneborni TaxID=65129 RepID=A0A8S1RWW0_9CILI|nr:unnamed protein product [Paramecium sonneborni]
MKKFMSKNVSDCLDFLSKYEIQQHFGQENSQTKISNVENNHINLITKILKKIHGHGFNQIDYSLKAYKQTREILIKKFYEEEKLFNFQYSQFVQQLLAFDKKFIQIRSNLLNLQVHMKVNLHNQSFENIKIKNTSLIGGNFVGCNLSGSQFNNVNINGVNSNKALLMNCKFKNIKIPELNKLEGHNSGANSVFISPDRTQLASSSGDKSIRLWNVKTGVQQAKLNGHTNSVYSICFSPDSTLLASGSFDNSIRSWNIKIGQQKAELDGHTNSVCFSPDGITLASGSDDNSIRLWDIKKEQLICDIRLIQSFNIIIQQVTNWIQYQYDKPPYISDTIVLSIKFFHIKRRIYQLLRSGFKIILKIQRKSLF